ncbi:MAG: P1 family peptidase [Actinobacteria bacterium]|nr:P1 family peptidase [Actinomycetota bacterium]
MIWEIDGVRVGHWSDPVARTGCTAVLFEPAAVASGEVRGGAPASHELALLDPTATVERIDAVVLTGGSAFGLASTFGVTAWCEERGRGVPTPAGRVPIVVGMGLFDLAVGDATVRPGPVQGRSACDAAIGGDGAAAPGLGIVGAGCGATVGKWRGLAQAVPGGLVGAVQRDGELAVAALVAVNAWGDVDGVGRSGEPWPSMPPPGSAGARGAGPFANTTIGVVVTNARLDKLGCHHVARGAHDGLARAVTPPHSHVDGDAFVAAATGDVDAAPELVRALAVTVVDRAIRSVGSVA